MRGFDKNKRPLFQAIVYTIFGVCWIVLSDKIAMLNANNFHTIGVFQQVKGIVFIILTALAFYVLLNAYNRDLLAAGERLIKINRILRMLSLCNKILTVKTNEKEFMGDICALLVRDGGYKLAWIGIKQYDPGRSVMPVATSGDNSGYVEKLNITWEDAEKGRGPTGTAIRTGNTVIARDLKKQNFFIPWIKDAQNRGFVCSISVPLAEEGEVFGALNIYSGESGAFSKEEASLFEEMAVDIVYGIKSRRLEEKQEATQMELEENYERLKDMEAAKSNFISIVSHELRTPLTPIQGYLEFMSKGVAGELTKKQMEFVEAMKRNSEKLRIIIDELVDLTRIENRVISINKQPGTDLAVILLRAAKDMSFTAEKVGIKIKLECVLESFKVNADAARLSQVLVILFNNALKFSPKDSVIFASIKKCGQTIKPPAGFNIDPEKIYCLINIKDKGMGIKPDDLDKIFDKFYQVEKAINRMHGGLGLGLTIAKDIIEAHDGVIWAESEGIGKGTEFNILLPG